MLFYLTPIQTMQDLVVLWTIRRLRLLTPLGLLVRRARVLRACAYVRLIEQTITSKQGA